MTAAPTSTPATAGCGRWGCDCSRTGDDNDCPRHRATIDAKPDGHGHLVTIDGQEIRFDSVWDAHGEEPRSLVAWTHDMTDREILAHIRAYLEGPFAGMTYAPHEHFGVTPDEYAAMSDRDLFPDVRRVWARWLPPIKVDYYEDEDSGIRWEEHDEPGDGLRPACVVSIE